MLMPRLARRGEEVAGSPTDAAFGLTIVNACGAGAGHDVKESLVAMPVHLSLATRRDLDELRVCVEYRGETQSHRPAVAFVWLPIHWLFGNLPADEAFFGSVHGRLERRGCVRYFFDAVDHIVFTQSAMQSIRRDIGALKGVTITSTSSSQLRIRIVTTRLESWPRVRLRVRKVDEVNDGPVGQV